MQRNRDVRVNWFTLALLFAASRDSRVQKDQRLADLGKLLPELEFGIGYEPTHRAISRLCSTLIGIHFGSKFLSTNYFAKRKVEIVELAILPIPGSL
jgi:hypothetical protein